MDEPTAALGVRESGQVLELIGRIRDRGLPVILISHNMPQVFEVSDRIHIQRLGRRVDLISAKEHTMAEAVAIMTGAMPGREEKKPAATTNDGAITTAPAAGVPAASALPIRQVREATGSLADPIGKP
nr:hypothetical protein [Frankia sp. Cas3]